MSVYSSEESSEEGDMYKGLSNSHYKCWRVFRGEEKGRVVGCDTQYCRQWFHPACTDVNFSGKTPQEIANTEFICKYC